MDYTIERTRISLDISRNVATICTFSAAIKNQASIHQLSWLGDEPGFDANLVVGRELQSRLHNGGPRREETRRRDAQDGKRTHRAALENKLEA